MRLLETQTLELEEFFENELPEYAILSHRWETDEITFGDMTTNSNRTIAQGKDGFAKVRDACKVALSQGFNYIWIDTCCINKSSSAELTEAINSMYAWYASAGVCYAFLSDVTDRDSLTSSMWFTRGWTLQELIAPGVVQFYSSTWMHLGDKGEHSVQISERTGIDLDVLEGHRDATDISVARRMFWAAGRKTTRVEDEAYCLLGLFDVNMPLIYGEGRKSFIRLQEEIMRITNDQSIFAWYTQERANFFMVSSMDVLALSPLAFLGSGKVSSQPFYRVGQKPITLTNQGVSLELILLAVDEGVEIEDSAEVDAILDCQIGPMPGTFPIIRLRKLADRNNRGVDAPYYRVCEDLLAKVPAELGARISVNLDGLFDDHRAAGLDPTQLSSSYYKDALADHNRSWQKKQITIARHIPPKYDNCLRPLDYWIVSIGIESFAFCARVIEAYPSRRWVSLSAQFRGNLPDNFFHHETSMVLDGVLGLEFVSTSEDVSPGRSPRSDISLLLGYLGDFGDPTPWCRLIYDDGVRDLARAYSKHKGIVEVKTKKKVNKKYGQSEHSLGLGHGYSLKASAKKKEVSGVMYYVVCLKPQIADSGGIASTKSSRSNKD